MRRALAVVLVALAAAVAAPGSALALCPNCLGQEPAMTPALELVGAFLLVPPAVFFVVVRVIRRLGSSS